VLLLLALACGDMTGTVADAEGRRDTLVIGLPTDVKSLLYVVAQSAADAAVMDATQRGMYGSRFDCSLQSTPDFARAWSFSEDGKTLDVELRDDLRWEDGTPVSAQDVAMTFDLVADAKVASPRAGNVEFMDPAARPEVIDPTHLRWRFTKAYDRVTMLSHTNLPPVPAHRLKDADRASLRGHPISASAPLSNGPFRVTKWEKNARLVLEPNPAFGGDAADRARLRRVIFKVLPEYATRLVELESGAIDVMESVLVADADKIAREHPEIRLYRRGWRFMDYVAWNSLDPADTKARAARLAPGETLDLDAVAGHALFADRAVRRALAKAIDVDKLIGDVLTSRATGERYGRPAIGTITPALCGAYNDAVQRFPYEPESARAELASLGWRDTDGDGVLDKQGRPFRFSMLVNAGNARREKSAILVQSMLRKVGVDMQVEKIESNTFFERLRKKDFDAALAGWSAALFIDPTSMWGRDSAFNFTSYRDPEAARIIEAGLGAPDPDAANAHWRALQARIYEDQPYAFLYWMDDLVAVHSRFEDVNVDILSPYGHLERWSVPADKVKYRF
jgi:peptide/nickel transport system substrate-binding protein